MTKCKYIMFAKSAVQRRKKSGKERQRHKSQLTMQHDYAILSWTARLLVIKTVYYKTAYSRDGADSSIHA